MEYKILKISITDRIACVTISRPAVLNALNTEFFREMDHFLHDLQGRDDVRVLVITGEGKAFVAGADISEMSGMEPEAAFEFSRFGQSVFAQLEKLRIPVIAAVNGYALGGGCELAMGCDFRIASKLAKFGQPEMNLGLTPGYAGTQRLSRIAGLGNALYMILSADTITADDAFRMGLVQKVCEPETLMDEVMKLASKIASNGSGAIPAIKRLIRDGITLPFEDGSILEAKAFSELFGEPATKEGMKAFMEKRKPEW
ncbi:MAG: enoyl-CoA hydratase-related protein [Bacteroidetes bacterium]|nr:enoyl-CoA hydratase-related protein [Bacteroidota bacterium]